MLEFGTFAPITAIEFSMCGIPGPAEKSFGDVSPPPAKETVSEKLFLAGARKGLLHIRAAAPYTKKCSFGPLEFKPPALNPDILLQQPPEKVLRRMNNYLEGTSGSRTIRLLRLPQAEAEQEIFVASSVATGALQLPATLMACGSCSHLFIHPPAHKALLREGVCTLCSTKGSFAPIIRCHALKFGQH